MKNKMDKAFHKHSHHHNWITTQKFVLISGLTKLKTNRWEEKKRGNRSEKATKVQKLANFYVSRRKIDNNLLLFIYLLGELHSPEQLRRVCLQQWIQTKFFI